MNALHHSVLGILLLRHHLFHSLPEAACLLRALENASCSEPQFKAFEVLLCEECGFVLSSRLRAHLQTFSASELAFLREWILQTLQDADILPKTATNTNPLNGHFPDQIPEDMEALWQSRFLSLFQGKDGVCLTCGAMGTTHVLEPCHHVVCSACFAGYTGCPVCGRPIDANHPFLESDENPPDTAAHRVVRLDLCPDLEAFARQRIHAFCATSGAMSPEDIDELQSFVRESPEKLESWLPEKIASRIAKAHILAALMARKYDDHAQNLLKKYLTIPTDVLRLIAVLSGQDGSLDSHRVVRRPRAFQESQEDDAYTLVDCRGVCHKIPCTDTRKSYRFKVARFSRAQRRAFLQCLDAMNPVRLTEDMLRHRECWVWVGEKLHPSEYAKRYPRVAEAFCVLRKKKPDGTRCAPFETWNTQLQRALESRNATAVQRLMSLRPGEFARHFDEVLRRFVMPTQPNTTQDDIPPKAGLFSTLTTLGKNIFMHLRHGQFEQVLEIFSQAGENLREVSEKLEIMTGKLDIISMFQSLLQHLTTPMLLQLYVHLGHRHHPLPTRIFVPAGKTHRLYWRPDTRPTISKMFTFVVRRSIALELFHRFSQRPKYETLLIDEELKNIAIPTSTHSDHAEIPSGSFFDFSNIKRGKMRLFLHWCQNEISKGATDLDLSVGFFDESWQRVDACTYYQLQSNYARHSGDFRDAPWPRGASEYIDIDIEKAQNAGVRYVVPLVNVYFGVDFSQLCRAFTGVMDRSDVHAKAFDPLTVRLRYPLRGQAGACVPFVIDLKTQKLLSLNAFWDSRNGNHFDRLKKAIAQIGAHSFAYHALHPHGTLYDLALFHAAARAHKVYIRRGDDFSCVQRDADESPSAFYARLRHFSWMAVPKRPHFEEPVLAFLHDDDLDLPENSVRYGVLPHFDAWKSLMNDE